jgi:putative methionine-R-sulfoxide reductase with GAF domain
MYDTRLPSWNVEPDVVEVLRGYVSLVLEASYLHRDSRQYADALRNMSELGESVLHGRDIEDILARAARAAQQLTESDVATIQLFRAGDPDHIYIEACYSPHGETPQVIDYPITLGRGITGKVAQTRVPLKVSNVTTYPNYVALFPATMSELAVPLLVGRSRAPQN